MVSNSVARIESIADAGRYLGELAGKLPFSEAVSRLQARSTPEVVAQLGSLASYVGGQTEQKPAAELSLLGEVARAVPDGGDSGQAINMARATLADARDLADRFRVGLPGDMFYVGTLLIIALVVAVTFMIGIAPQFSRLFDGFGTSIPWLTGIVIDAPWLLIGAFCMFGVAIAGLVICAFRLSSRIALVAPIEDGLVSFLAGPKLRRAHQHWRLLALTRAAAAGGEHAGAALTKAASATGVAEHEVSKLAGKIALAQDLGAADSELEHLLQQQQASYVRDLDIWRAIALRVLQVTIAVSVGVMVIAMYLPIFKMGAVV